MHGKTHKGQTIHSCTDCEFSANTSQQLDDHMNKHRGTQPFQCSECGLMFAARADLRAHITRTHRNASTVIQTTATPMTPMNRRPHRRAASLQHRFIGRSSTIDDENDEEHDDEFRCRICQRQFTSARLLDRHIYAVHQAKNDYYSEGNYSNENNAEEDDVRDYADDELEPNNANREQELHVNAADVDEEEEEDLAANVEDIAEGDEEFVVAPTIKSISSAKNKLRKFDEQDNSPNKKRTNLNRREFSVICLVA